MATKKNLQDKAKKATASLTGINKQSEQAFDDSMKKTTRRKKPTSDYIRLDLKPQGKDLKTYVTTQANKESIRRKENISATRYIQELIEADQQAHAKGNRKTTADELKERIDRMSKDKQSLFLEMFNMFDL